MAAGCSHQLPPDKTNNLLPPLGALTLPQFQFLPNLVSHYSFKFFELFHVFTINSHFVKARQRLLLFIASKVIQQMCIK